MSCYRCYLARQHEKLVSTLITAWLKWRLAAYRIINTAPDSIGADSVGELGPVDLANKMDKFLTNSSENSTVSKTEDSSSADVRQKKGRTFQTSWKGKYPWIDY